jgi:hypothetical protein
LIIENQLSCQQTERLLSLLEAQTGEKYMWGWVKKLFQPISYAIDLESVYQMAGV